MTALEAKSRHSWSDAGCLIGHPPLCGYTNALQVPGGLPLLWRPDLRGYQGQQPPVL